MMPLRVWVILIGATLATSASAQDPKAMAPEIAVFENASPALQGYFRQQDTEMIKLAWAFVANVCGYRSDAWYKSLNEGMWVRWTELQRSAGLTPKDLPTINKMNSLIFKRIAGKPNCGSVTAPMLNSLDAFSGR